VSFADLIGLTDRAAQTHLGGVAVTYTTGAGAVVTTNVDGDPLLGMFDEHYRVADQGNNGVEVISPAVSLRLEDLPTDPATDNPTITIASIVYTVRKRETDGSVGGNVRLLLRRVP